MPLSRMQRPALTQTGSFAIGVWYWCMLILGLKILKTKALKEIKHFLQQETRWSYLNILISMVFLCISVVLFSIYSLYILKIHYLITRHSMKYVTWWCYGLHHWMLFFSVFISFLNIDLYWHFKLYFSWLCNSRYILAI